MDERGGNSPLEGYDAQRTPFNERAVQKSCSDAMEWDAYQGNRQSLLRRDRDHRPLHATSWTV